MQLYAEVGNQSEDILQEFIYKYNIRDIVVERLQYEHDDYRNGYINRRGEVTVILNQDALRTLARDSNKWDQLSAAMLGEMRIRQRVPAVQDAWAKYQMLLAMSK